MNKIKLDLRKHLEGELKTKIHLLSKHISSQHKEIPHFIEDMPSYKKEYADSSTYLKILSNYYNSLNDLIKANILTYPQKIVSQKTRSTSKY